MVCLLSSSSFSTSSPRSVLPSSPPSPSDPEYLVVLEKAVETYLPSNYDFEILKSIQRLDREQCRHVALQLPEGLLAWSLQLASILKFFSQTVQDVTILSDVTYGACCIDDLTAVVLGCDFLIHYGHSCLVPTSHTRVFRNASSSYYYQRSSAHNPPAEGRRGGSDQEGGRRTADRKGEEERRTKGLGCLYVFVDILLDPLPLCEILKYNFSQDARLALLGTIQYAKVVLVRRRGGAGGRRELRTKGFRQSRRSGITPLCM